MAVVRKQILLNESQNKRLQKLRAVTGISESEIVRRALESYDPGNGTALEDNEEARELLETLVAQNVKTAQALQLAESEIAATERYLRKLRAERRKSSRSSTRVERKAAHGGKP